MEEHDRLFAIFGSVAGALHGKVGFDGEEVGEGGALLVGELAPKASGVKNSLALRNRHLADIAEGAGYKAAAIDGKAAELLHRSTNLLPLRRREPFHHLGAFKQAAALFRRHVIELRQPVLHPLLRLLRQFAETRFILESLLLLRERQIAVAVHPLREMLLLRPLRMGIRRALSKDGSWCGRPSGGLREERGRGRKEAANRKSDFDRGGKNGPGWSEEGHMRISAR